MRLRPWLLLLSACGGAPEPTVTTTPPIEDVEPPPRPLARHDLAGAPAYGTAPACTPVGTGPSGAELAAAVDAIRTGTPAETVDHRVLLAGCEIERRALADAYVAGGGAARGASH